MTAVRTYARAPQGSGGRSFPLGSLVALVVALVVGVLIGQAAAPGVARPKGPGPNGSRGRVASGFAHTRAGAAAAATSYIGDVSSPATMFDRAARHRVMGAIASSASRVKLQAQQDEMVNAIAKTALGRDATAGAAVQLQWVPLGYRVVEDTSKGIVVSMWGFALVGSAAKHPQLVWETNRMALVWEAGDWRLVGFDSKPGPAVESRWRASPGREIIDTARASTPYRYVP